ncbi:hypothetical protein GETHLI_20040 [Geothrix limicola]|uniref:Uncharacterized protein n=1 Tax=Geothrix limicola TaxID=2927978 RepID=A0ABQ5QFS1_9BACT|nr:hypothetical protein [Geothrix limicola]GLH73502.1 hypothetical protein GETHLI_20040 [Geothrix limicola]
MMETQAPLTPARMAELIEAQQWLTLGHRFREVHPADAAELMSHLSPEAELGEGLGGFGGSRGLGQHWKADQHEKHEGRIHHDSKDPAQIASQTGSPWRPLRRR